MAEESRNRLKGTLIDLQRTDRNRHLKEDSADKRRSVAKIETIEDFIVTLIVGSNFESVDYKYDVTDIKGETVATNKFDKRGKFIATQTFHFESLWDYYQEDRISLSK